MRIAWITAAVLSARAAAPTWEADIAPLFSKHCNGCHAATVTMGSLNLDTYEGVLKGGNHGTILVPGKPAESRLYTMLIGKAAPAMPMDGKVLAPAQIALVESWIASGAPGPAKAADASTARKQLYSVAWHPSASIAAMGGYKEIVFSDGRAAETGYADAVRAVEFSKDGRLLAGGGGLCGRRGEVIIREGSSVKTTISGHSDCIYAIAFAPDSKSIATASYDKLIKIWDVETGKEIRTLKDHIDAIYALAFTPDGKRIVSGAADRTIKVWDPATGERLYTMGEPSDGVNTIAISADGASIAAGGADKTLRIWKLRERSAELVATQIAHEDAILRIAFSKDGKRLISAAADRTMKVFSVPDLAELRSLERLPDWASGLSVSPDGKRLAVTCLDGSSKMISMETIAP